MTYEYTGALSSNDEDEIDERFVGKTREEIRKIKFEDWKDSLNGPEEGYHEDTGTTVAYRVERFSYMDFSMYKIFLIRSVPTLGVLTTSKYMTDEDYDRWIGDGIHVAWSWAMYETEMRIHVAEVKLQEISRRGWPKP